MRIIVRTECGATFSEHVKDGYTVAILKDIIQERHGLPVKRQSIRLNGVSLDDNATLKDCGLKDGTVIHMVLRISH